jgi:para-nitrobenzyl esterase
MLTPELKLPAGSIRGVERDSRGVLAFKGIPYAAPPVGALRWRPPQDPAPWSGVRDATVVGNPCIGAPMPMPVLRELTRNQSEDCLTLNVWTPAQSAQARLPVMVWIHGGGFEFGASTFFSCAGNHLSAEGAVVVGMNYRLGVFGFLSHPQLDREGTASGNFGLQDMIKALHWVQSHVALFGGDPDNVTLFGESAGSHAVGMLMASPLARGLFHRAIGQSGAFWDTLHGSMNSQAEAQHRGQQLMDTLGVSTVAELRAVPALQLNRLTAWNFLLNPAVKAFFPNVDGYVLPDYPATIFEQGKQLDIPVLGGWCRDEHAFFMSHALPHGTPKAFRTAAARQFGEARMADFLAVYPASDRKSAKRSAELLVGDLLISQQTWAWLGTHSATATSKVFVYNYEYSSPYSPRPVHCADLAFVFGSVDESYIPSKAAAGPADRELSAVMRRYWVNFARTGDPNDGELPQWPAYRGGGSHIMHFGATVAAAPEEGEPCRHRNFDLAPGLRQLPVVAKGLNEAEPRGAGPLRRVILFAARANR